MYLETETLIGKIPTDSLLREGSINEMHKITKSNRITRCVTKYVYKMENKFLPRIESAKDSYNFKCGKKESLGT